LFESCVSPPDLPCGDGAQAEEAVLKEGEAGPHRRDGTPEALVSSGRKGPCIQRKHLHTEFDFVQTRPLPGGILPGCL
ncbi:hypothetical protein NE581_10995, partial [Streptococcus parasanguinis]|nr:hypothetical protein [Streptococcus parasanguinis]